MGQEISKSYKNIECEDLIVDNMCMQLVMRPENYDVIVAPNLYGDILSDLCAGLVGGLGVVAGANIGNEVAIFEAVHGTAPDIAGENVANPISLLRTAGLMLRHIGFKSEANHLDSLIDQSIAEGSTTIDLGGNLSTDEYSEMLVRQVGGSYENL
jgi:isocitrate dehydrogenase (NAD+)